MTKLITFTEALQRSESKHRHVLLGNGFSIACYPRIFTYGSLFERADFSALSSHARQTFDDLKTTDFEIVMRALKNAALLLKIYEPTAARARAQMQADSDGLREVLVQAIASNHPERPSDIDTQKYTACRAFLNHFERYYTFNYDLLLYWTIMQDEIAGEVQHDDGFRTPEDGPEEYVTWEVENSRKQNVFYLHGALHLFDAGAELKKYTWVNTGVHLIEQVRKALTADLFPLVVAEGTSREKITRINHSGYLHRGLRSFKEIGGDLFIFGHAMSDNDTHILKSISANRNLARLFVSIYGDPDTDDNTRIKKRAKQLAASRPERAGLLELHFYDAASAKVWG